MTTTFSLADHLERQRAFSLKTFGPGERTAMVCDHIRKELREIEAAPADPAEWFDVIILALDGAWRAGLQPATIEALVCGDRSLLGHLAHLAPVVKGNAAATHLCRLQIRDLLTDIEACPCAPSWAFIAIRGLEGALASGLEPPAIIEGIVAKQTKNECRTWPDWRTAPADKAIEHVRDEPQPVTPRAVHIAHVVLAIISTGGAVACLSQLFKAAVQ